MALSLFSGLRLLAVRLHLTGCVISAVTIRSGLQRLEWTMAWTEITRAKYRRDGLRYASDTTDQGAIQHCGE